MGSPSRFFSASSGRVIGSRPGSAGTLTTPPDAGLPGYVETGPLGWPTIEETLLGWLDIVVSFLKRRLTPAGLQGRRRPGPIGFGGEQARHRVVHGDDAIGICLDVHDPRVVALEV